MPNNLLTPETWASEKRQTAMSGAKREEVAIVERKSRKIASLAEEMGLRNSN